MDKSNIILIGMPGSGKSSCGVIAAKGMLKNFFDTDLLIQGMERKMLQDIIDENGIDYFIKAEEKAILTLELNATLIATGGSVVYSDKAMQHLRSMGKIVYLHISYDTMKGRIKNLSTRGVVIKSGSSLLDMYNERVKLYKKYADIVIDCDGDSVDDTAEKIVNAGKI